MTQESTLFTLTWWQTRLAIYNLSLRAVLKVVRSNTAVTVCMSNTAVKVIFRLFARQQHWLLEICSWCIDGRRLTMFSINALECETRQLVSRLMTEVAAFVICFFRSWTINNTIRSVWRFLDCFMTMLDCPGVLSTSFLDIIDACSQDVVTETSLLKKIFTVTSSIGAVMGVAMTGHK